MTARLDRATSLLCERGAARVPHPGGTLLEHLERTRQILETWSTSEPLQLAGLCHAAYGTDGFPTALFALDERAVLADAVGAEAEAIVYLYDACDRSRVFPVASRRPMPFVDRFTGKRSLLDDGLASAVVTITAANELDVIRHADLSTAETASIEDLLASLTGGLPGPARLAIDGLRNR